MGDTGKLYIPEDEVPEYKGLLREADLILPNQFEAELVHHAYKTMGILTGIIDYSLTLRSPTSSRSPPQSKSFTRPTKSRT